MNHQNKTRKASKLYQIFSLINYLNERSNTSTITLILITIIESLQIQYFSFSGKFNDFWDVHLKWFQRIIKMCHYLIPQMKFDYFLFKMSFFIYVVLMYLFLFLFIQSMRRLYRNKEVNQLILIYLNIYLLFQPILFIPFLTNFIQLFICKDLFSCWSLENIILMSISLISIIQLLIFSFFTCDLVSNVSLSKISFKSKIISSNFQRIFLLKKAFLVFAYEFSDYFTEYNIWILSILNLIFSFSSFLILYVEKPFFERNTQFINITLRATELFGSVVLLINIGINDINQSDVSNNDNTGILSLSLFLLGICSIIIYFFINRDERIEEYLTQKSSSCEKVIKNIFLLLKWFEDEHKESYTIGRAMILVENEKLQFNSNHSSIIMKRKAFIEKIEERNSFALQKSKFEVCNRNKINENPSSLMREEDKSDSFYSSSDIKSLIIEESQLFIDYINEIFISTKENFPNNNDIKLYYIDFILNYTNNTTQCEYYISEISNKNSKSSSTLNLKQKYFLFILELSLYRSSIIKNKTSTANSMFDNNEVYQYNLHSDYDIFIDLIYYYSEKTKQLWESIITKDFNLNKLINLVIDLNDKMKVIVKNLNSMSSLLTDYRTYQILQKFYSHVVNSSILEQSELNLKRNFPKSKTNQYIRNNILNYIHEGNAYIVINAEDYFLTDCKLNSKSKNKISVGDILTLNSTCCKIFGMTKEEAMTSNLNSLLPEMIKVPHEKNLKRIYDVNIKNKSNLTIQNKDFKRIFSLGVHKTGYVFPLNMTLSILTGLKSNISLLGLIRTPDSTETIINSCYFLCDQSLNIQYISREVTNLLGYSQKDLYKLEEKIVYMTNYEKRSVNGHDDDKNSSKNIKDNFITTYRKKNKEKEKIYLKIDQIIPKLSRLKENISEIEAYCSSDREKIYVDTIFYKSKHVFVKDDNHICYEKRMNSMKFEISASKLKIQGKVYGYIFKLDPIEVIINRKPVLKNNNEISLNITAQSQSPSSPPGSNQIELYKKYKNEKIQINICPPLKKYSLIDKTFYNIKENKKSSRINNDELVNFIEQTTSIKNHKPEFISKFKKLIKIPNFNIQSKEDQEIQKEVEIFLAENGIENYSNDVLLKVYNTKTKSIKGNGGDDDLEYDCEIFGKLLVISNLMRNNNKLFESIEETSNEQVNVELIRNRIAYLRKTNFEDTSKLSIFILFMKISIYLSGLIKISLLLIFFISSINLNSNFLINLSWINSISQLYYSSTRNLLGTNTLYLLNNYNSSIRFDDESYSKFIYFHNDNINKTWLSLNEIRNKIDTEYFSLEYELYEIIPNESNKDSKNQSQVVTNSNTSINNFFDILFSSLDDNFIDLLTLYEKNKENEKNVTVSKTSLLTLNKNYLSSLIKIYKYFYNDLKNKENHYLFNSESKTMFSYISIGILLLNIPFLLIIYKIEISNMEAMKVLFSLSTKTTYQYISNISQFQKFIHSLKEQENENSFHIFEKNGEIDGSSENSNKENSLIKGEKKENNVNEKEFLIKLDDKINENEEEDEKKYLSSRINDGIIRSVMYFLLVLLINSFDILYFSIGNARNIKDLNEVDNIVPFYIDFNLYQIAFGSLVVDYTMKDIYDIEYFPEDVHRINMLLGSIYDLNRIRVEEYLNLNLTTEPEISEIFSTTAKFTNTSTYIEMFNFYYNNIFFICNVSNSCGGYNLNYSIALMDDYTKEGIDEIEDIINRRMGGREAILYILHIISSLNNKSESEVRKVDMKILTLETISQFISKISLPSEYIATTFLISKINNIVISNSTFHKYLFPLFICLLLCSIMINCLFFHLKIIKKNSILKMSLFFIKEEDLVKESKFVEYVDKHAMYVN